VTIQPPKQKQPDGQPQKPRSPINWFWWIVLISLMLWNVITYFKAAPAQVEIPYSTFIDQVQTGNISSVTITGNVITGIL
jgi:hypothetical protein